MRGLAPALLIAITATLWATPHAATARSAAESSVNNGLKEALASYQAKDQRLQDIGWRLVSSNAQYCEVKKLSIGLQLLDAAGFADPDAILAITGAQGDFTVQTVAVGSPSALAGLAHGRTVKAIDEVAPDLWPAQVQYDWERLKRAHDLIDASLEFDGVAFIRLADGTQYDIAGIPTCPTRFELTTGNDRARADGSRVIVGESFVGFTYLDDELAAAVAHELAHNLLGHRASLDSSGRKRKQVRATEREADRLMPWLLANAGYDPAAATRFMAKWGPKHGGGLFRKRTHEGWDERVEQIGAEVALVEALMSEGAPAEWSAHFTREVEPAGQP